MFLKRIESSLISICVCDVMRCVYSFNFFFMKTKNTFFLAGLFFLAFGALFAFATGSAGAYSSYVVPKSDLVISKIQTGEVVRDQYVTLTLEVENIGEKASRNSWVGIYDGETFKRSCPVSTLIPGSKTVVPCKYYIDSSINSQLTFIVDDMEEIWESNENNNTVLYSLGQSYVAPVHMSESTSYFPTEDPLMEILEETPFFEEDRCAGCYSGPKTTHIQGYFTRFGNTNYEYDPNAKIYTVDSNTSGVSCPYGTNRSCVAIETFGKNNATGQCKSFPTTCLPPEGWTRVAKCETSSVVTKKPTKPFIEANDEHFAVYNGQLAGDRLITVYQGDSVDAEIALMEIDNTKRNFVYQNISNNFSLNTIEFPEDAVKCWTQARSSGTTVYCRGQEANSSIRYQLTARKTGDAPILTRVQYDQDGQKIERKGTQNFYIEK